ncbi:MAG: ABC transporter permease [Sedimentisphaerales bacterium]|nr:ABC transporter permease [Sedimentisphaerales bacterium]
MRISDYIEQSLSNLRKKKLRTFLTTFGVVIGIGALVSMFAFGKGMQKNFTDTFSELELFNYVGVYARSLNNRGHRGPDHSRAQKETSKAAPVLDDAFLLSLAKIEGVEWALPEIRFPALIKLADEEEFSLIQVLPADLCQAGFVKLRAGDFYASDEEKSLIISDSLLRRLKIKKTEDAIGREIELSTLTVDFSLSNLKNIISFLKGTGLPFSKQNYTFTIVGIIERMGMTGPMPVRSDVFIPHGTSRTMKKISITSVSDIFQSMKPSQGYSAIGIKLSSPKYVEPVKDRMEDMGFETFAMLDQLEEIKTGFRFLDLFLFAVGMIGISVAALGIINTMVMSILERYKEIGIMKAVGASDKDVKKIFFFESGVIGFLGGVFGLVLGWVVSNIINLIINSVATQQGVPRMSYFRFPWWLCLGAIAFSILISLLAGIYPTLRAARVDPVVALRHD